MKTLTSEFNDFMTVYFCIFYSTQMVCICVAQDLMFQDRLITVIEHLVCDKRHFCPLSNFSVRKNEFSAHGHVHSCFTHCTVYGVQWCSHRSHSCARLSTWYYGAYLVTRKAEGKRSGKSTEQCPSSHPSRTHGSSRNS